MSKHLVRIGVAVLTTLLALVVLWQFRTIVIYVLISLMLAATIRPLFARLTGRGFIFRLFWILIFVIAAVGTGFLFFLVFRSSGIELQNLAHNVSAQDKWMFSAGSSSSFQQTILSRLPPPSILFQAVIGSEGELVIPALIGIAQGIGGAFTAIAIILILSLYWSINQIHFERLWLSLLPSDQRKRARGIWRTIEPDIGAYIQGQLLQSLLTGVLLGLGYWLFGSPYPVLLALVGAFLCLIPVVGPVLAILPPLLVGLLTTVQLSLVTGLFTLMMFIALFIWVKPRLQKPRWNNPVLMVVLLIVLAYAFGIVGIIIAPPVSIIFQILWSRLVTKRVAAGAALQISDLKARLELVRESIITLDDPHLPLVISSLERISNLIDEAEPLLPPGLPAETSQPSPLPG